MSTGPRLVTGSSEREVEAVLCPDGPMLLRGATAVRTADGVSHPTPRPVVAVCACGKSQRQPWCDGTHKVVRHADG
jgi:CDGSH-type Zn-finger protein